MTSTKPSPKQRSVALRNRANARRSTGPRSIAGKVRAAANALTHGLTAESPRDEAEAADRQRRAAVLAMELVPETPLEQALVARMAAALQRLERADRLEVQAFEAATGWGDSTSGKALMANRRCQFTFLLVNRYRATANGELLGTLRALKALQAERRTIARPGVEA
ncbi:MAG: hypothetical protein AAFX81_06945 [Pseudomonadota bacterium]